MENESGGQPYLLGPDGARLPGCLSISHREGQALCALSFQPGARLGADLEWVEPRDPIFIADYLGLHERQLALGVDGDLRDFFVTLAWSAKEAAFKALGTGLRMDTRRIEIVGGFDWLAVGALLPQGWQPMSLAGPGLPGPARAFWQLRGKYILVFVALGSEALQLVEFAL